MALYVADNLVHEPAVDVFPRYSNFTASVLFANATNITFFPSSLNSAQSNVLLVSVEKVSIRAFTVLLAIFLRPVFESLSISTKSVSFIPNDVKFCAPRRINVLEIASNNFSAPSSVFISVFKSSSLISKI